MPSRLEIELTSVRPDGSWTWRKAGAKLPKGEVGADLVPAGSSVGDVLRAEAEQLVDGTEIVAILPPKEKKAARFETLEVVGTKRDEALVTTQLAPKGRGRGDRRDRGDRGDRGERGDRDRGPRRDRGERGSGGDRGDRGDRRGPRDGRDRGPRRPEADRRPPAKRLKPLRTHRTAVLDSLPPEQRPIAEQVLRGGVPAVRQAVEQQNVTNRAEGRPEISGDELVVLAERMAPKLKAAEWRDRAEAALAVIEELDLRDLRSVVVAADGNARDEEARALAQTLKDALGRRVEAEHTTWLAELTATLADGRIVRALRLSSRPPKAGAPLPAEVTAKLVEQASAALTAETVPDRWATVLDALAFSPVRTAVTPQGKPSELGDELRTLVARLGDRIPHIAAFLEVEVTVSTGARRGGRRGGGGGGGGAKTAAPRPTPEAPAVESEAAAVDAPAEDAPVVDAPVEAPEEAVSTEPEGGATEPEAVAAEPESSAVESEPEPEPESSGAEEPATVEEPQEG